MSERGSNGGSHGDGQRGSLEARLAGRPPLLLDGATGTELERRGVRSVLPLWSAHALIEAPDVVASVHADYVRAGADILTANTFRTQRRALARGAHGDRAAELTRRAVELARRAADAAGTRPVLVAGSSPPLEDCYHPERVPDAASLAREHAEHAEYLAAAGVDLVLVETMNTVREACAALEAAAAAGLGAIVSFVCTAGARLLSGEPLAAALEAVVPHAPLAVAVNCLPRAEAAACLPLLLGSGLRFGAWPNLGAPPGPTGAQEHSDACAPREFAMEAARWMDAGAALFGGCCGTTPAHIAAIRQLLDARPAST